MAVFGIHAPFCVVDAQEGNMRARVGLALTVAWTIVGMAPSVADEVPLRTEPPVSLSK